MSSVACLSTQICVNIVTWMLCLDAVVLGGAVSKKWLRFSFAKNCGFRFGFGFTKLTAVSVFLVCFFCTVCCLVCMMLEMTYFRAELVQLIASRSDLELEVQKYGMKKNALTVDAIMLQDELWIRQREKPSPNCQSRFLENQTTETEFSVFQFWGRFGSVFRKPISEIFIRFHTPLCCLQSLD